MRLRNVGSSVIEPPTCRLQKAHVEQLLHSIVESSDDAIVSTDADGVITSWNAGAQTIYGYSAAEMVGRPSITLIPRDRRDEEPRILDRILRGEYIRHYDTVRQRKDGSLVEVSITASPVRDGHGRIVGASKIARDITERRQGQEQQKLLLAEMKHRIKNTLAIAQAIASQTLKGHAEDCAAFIARLHALASAHDALTENWEGAALDQLVTRALAPFDEIARERIFIDGPNVVVNGDQSLMLTLIFHELATNACKYGALSNPSGRIAVDWVLLDGSNSGRARISWRECGGPPVEISEHKGFGSRIIGHGIDNASAHIEFAPGGLRYSLDISAETSSLAKYRQRVANSCEMRPNI